MQMHTEVIDGDITRVTLQGRMDYDGATEVEGRFAALAGQEKFVLVDLAQVDFLASMGIRTLILAAKQMQAHGGKLILFNPNLLVSKVLKTSGTDLLIPVYFDLHLAYKALRPTVDRSH
jgi:anti-anti-sigma factor